MANLMKAANLFCSLSQRTVDNKFDYDLDVKKKIVNVVTPFHINLMYSMLSTSYQSKVITEERVNA